MNKVVKVDFGRRKRPTSVLGLVLESGRIEAVHVHRTNGSVKVGKSVAAPLKSAVPGESPEALGKEIRAILDQAGLRERNCVVAIPSRWLLTGRTEMPDLPEADAAGLLQLEAERVFSTDASSLRIADSRCVLADGKRHVTLVGVSADSAMELEQALEIAGLKIVSLTSGVTELQQSVDDAGSESLSLVPGTDHLGLQVTAGGGVAALRTIEGSAGEDGAKLPPASDVVAREIRITLGQLPEDLRRRVTQVRIFGAEEPAARLADGLRQRFSASGLHLDVVTTYPATRPAPGVAPSTPLSTALSLAARYLMGHRPAFEFLPPKPTFIGALVAKYSAGRLKTAVALAAVAALLIGGVLLYQQIQLASLNSQWSRISAKVSELDGMQQRIRQYRPWFDESFSNLAVVRQLSLAFPQDGSVTATSIEIREGTSVSCSGTARDSATFLRMLDALNSAPGVTSLHRDQIRGTSPIQFTFGFQWNPGGAR